MKQFGHNFYTVGITGHRDLLSSELEIYKRQIKEYLKDLKNTTKKHILLISPLADGADRVFIDVGRQLNMEYQVVLPMPLHLYSKDFSEASLSEFNSLLIRAKNYSSIDIVDGYSEKDIADYGEARDKQYFAVGRYLADNCNALVALWDGKDNKKVGGTADVVAYRKSLGKDFFHVKCKRESDK